ncbi:hypothetical protein [Paenibacillus sp. KS1]|nr:hypothetical protein [Paenibacillus sp. KS1]
MMISADSLLGSRPVLYPIAALAALLAVTAVFVWGTTLLFRRRQAC